MIGVLALLAALAGCHDAGDPCTKSDQCGEGVCLKGACSVYPCEAGGCADDTLVCASIAGSEVCVAPCEDDDACPGDQTCRAPSDAPEGARHCL